MRSFLRECVDLKRFVGLRKEERQIVFYTEGRGYLPYFEGFIRELLRQPSLTICYITSEPDDPILSQAPDRLRSFYFKHLLPFVILFLDAKVLVMTLPDLNRYSIRRSVWGTRHVYIFHAMVSTHMIYRFGAFDHYDVIFCVGPHHLSELRRSEQLYQTPAKQLLEVGYPSLDRLLQMRSDSLAPAGRRVLIAPSWGADNILESCVSEVVRALVKDDFTVVIRPHPEWVKRYPKRLAQLRQKWPEDSKVKWDFGPLTDQTLLESDVLITDWSGIALEYAFGTERPVLFMEVPRKVHNPRYEELGIIPLEVRLRDRIGKTVLVERSGQMGSEVRDLLENQSAYRDRILEERTQSVYHPGAAGRVGGQFLLELCLTV